MKTGLTKKHNKIGLLFVLPFIIGFLLLYLYPLIQSFVYSLGDIDIQNGNKVVFKGIENYVTAIRVDSNFYQYLLDAIKEMFLKLPVILVFSFILANILKPTFFGRNAVRLILFLPVILSSGIVTGIESDDMVQGMFSSMISDESSLVSIDDLRNFLLGLNFPTFLTEFVMDAVEQITVIVNSSGIQILIFLSALQSIPPSLYEASSVEGASSWENFWLITFPMVMPQIIVCTVYTIIDLFCGGNNAVMRYIHTQAFSNMRFGLSSAMSWIFTAIILVALLLYCGLFSVLQKHYQKGE